MQVTALGHRKTILKAAETLRKNRKVDINSLLPVPPSEENNVLTVAIIIFIVFIIIIL